MEDDALAHELDERALERMTDRQILEQAVRQQYRSSKDLKETMAGFTAQCTTCITQGKAQDTRIAQLKVETVWLWRVIGISLISAVGLLIKQALGK